MNHDTPGFELPVYQGLMQPQLIAGAPRPFVIPLVTVTAVGLVWRLWFVLPLALLLHGFAVWGTRQDPHWWSILLAHLTRRPHYEG